MIAVLVLAGVIVTLFGAYCALRSVHRRPKRTEDGLPPDRVVGDTIYRAFKIPATATVEAFTDALDLTLEEAASWDPKTEKPPPAIRARQQERYRNWLKARKGKPSRVQAIDDGEAPQLTARPARIRPVSPITTATSRTTLRGTQPHRRSRPPLKTVGHYPLGGVRELPNFIIGDAPGVERRCSCGAHLQGSPDDVAERWQAHLHADERTFGSKAADRVFAWLEKRQERVEGRAASVDKARSLLKATSLLSVLFFLALSIDAAGGGRWNHDFKDPLIRSIAEAARSVGATGSAITANTGAQTWGTNAAWVGSVQPTAADDVTIPNTATVTIASGSTALCRSLNVQAGGAVAFAATTSNLNIGDASGGALTVATTGTITLTGVGTINFLSTSTSGGTGWTVNPGGTGAGHVMPNLTFNNTGKWVFGGAVTATGAVVTLTQGTLDTGSFSLTCGSFLSSNTNTRALTLGSSAVTCTTGATTVWSTNTSTGLTVTANTATVTVNGATATVNGGSVNANGASLIMSGSGTAICQGSTSTWANLTRTGTAVKTDGLSFGSPSLNVTGMLTLTGNTTQGVNRLLVQSSVVGTQRTITVGSVVINGDVDFSDIAITYSGGASWTNSGAAFVGDAGGNNSTITTNATVAANQTATGTASFTWSTHGWTSRVPLPQDNVFIPNAFVAGRTITVDMPRLGANVDLSGATGSPAWNPTVSHAIFGSFAFASGMTNTSSSANTMSLQSRTSSTFTSGGVSFPNLLTFTGPSGTYTLQDALLAQRTGGTSTLLMSTGTLDANGFSVTIGLASSQGFVMQGGTLNMGSGTWTLATTVSVTVWSVTAGTVNASTSTIVISAASANTRIFAGGGKTYGTLTYIVANSPGNLTITNAGNTFNTINIGPGRSWTIPSLPSQNITNLNANGSANGYLYLPGVAANYVSTPDSAALSITGDIDIRVRVALDDWTPTAAIQILSKFLASTNQRSYRLFVNTDGTLNLTISTTGANAPVATSSVATGIADGSLSWIRATWRQSDGRTQFFTASGALVAPQGADWAPVGTNQTVSAGSTIFDSTTEVEIGASEGGTSGFGGGKFYKADVRNNILDDGTGIQLSADFTTKPFLANTFTDGSANAATMTINGTLAQQGDGRVTFSSGTPASQATLATTAGATVIGNVIQDIAATPSKAVYALDSTDGGNNSGIVFSPPDVMPQQRQPTPRVPIGAVNRASRW